MKTYILLLGILMGILGSYFLTTNMKVIEQNRNNLFDESEIILAKADSSNQYIYIVDKNIITADYSSTSLNPFNSQSQCLKDQNVNKNSDIFYIKNLNTNISFTHKS